MVVELGRERRPVWNNDRHRTPQRKRYRRCLASPGYLSSTIEEERLAVNINSSKLSVDYDRDCRRRDALLPESILFMSFSPLSMVSKQQEPSCPHSGR